VNLPLIFASQHFCSTLLLVFRKAVVALPIVTWHLFFVLSAVLGRFNEP
jgi:hypothetical protein